MKHTLIFIAIFLPCFVLFDCGQNGYKIYVSPYGNDSASGRVSAPVASLQKAANMARDKGRELPVTVFLSDGNYILNDPLVLGPEDGGTNKCPVIWKALPGAEPVISGGIALKSWKEEKNGLWSTSLPNEVHHRFRSLYINNRRAIRARYPDDGYLRIGKAGTDNRTNFFYGKDEVPEIKHIEDVELVFLHDWSVTRIGVKSINRNKR
jgi:hypothetical protein